MRRIFTILLVLLPLLATAQPLRISGFASSPRDICPAFVYDADGALCSVLKIETGIRGLTFEAGLAGIMDVSYADGVIYVYVPAGARVLSVGHPRYTGIRDWILPRTLEPGMVYVMKIDIDHPGPLTTKTVADDRTFCSHFIDAWLATCIVEGETGEYFIGMRYTYLQNKVGPYVSFAFSTEEGRSFFAGAAFRITAPETSNLDLHLYGGIGLVHDSSFAAEAGLRFAWKKDSSVSGWDFGVGCQAWRGCIAPTVEVGLYIWGIPVLCCLSVCL